MSPLRRILVLLGVTAVVLLAIAGPADAHTGSSAEAASEGRTAVTFSFSHGCSGKATIGLRAQLPPGATTVTADNPTGWTSTVSASEVHWTGVPIADGTAGSFTMTLVFAEPAGTTVSMPNIQECTDNTEIAWIGAPSSETSESTRPAPTVVVPANSTAAPTAATPTTATSGPTTTVRMAIETSPITDEGSRSSRSGLIVFVVVTIVIAVGALVLWLKYRKPTTKS